MGTFPKHIYFDHGATTPVHPEVVQSVNACFTKFYGNPSEPHRLGREAKQILNQAKKTLGSALGADPAEIIFTSGGTESNNLAVFGTAEAYRNKGNHIISSSIEHPAIMLPLKRLQRKGYEITFLPVDSMGMIDPQKVLAAIRPQTILVTIMHANNVFGSIEPIAQIGEILREKKIPFHSDAAQSFCHIPTDVSALQVDLLSISGHKFYGPKGIGALYIRKGSKIMPQIFGGGQQRGLRPGTENIPLIAGLAKACQLSQEHLTDRIIRVTVLREYLVETVRKKIQGIRLCGHPLKRLPGNCCFTLNNVSGQDMVDQLDQANIAVSGSSACAASSMEPASAITALGISCEEAVGSIRISLGYENTLAEVDYFLDVFPKIVTKLRSAANF